MDTIQKVDNEQQTKKRGLSFMKLITVIYEWGWDRYLDILFRFSLWTIACLPVGLSFITLPFYKHVEYYKNIRFLYPRILVRNMEFWWQPYCQ